MKSYLELLRDVLDNGIERTDVQGVGNIAVFCRELRFSPAIEFPLLTTKKIFFRGIAEELFWFLRGESTVDSLNKQGIHFWDAWATAEFCAQFGRAPGDLGPIYGQQWRKWKRRDGGTIDQVAGLIQEILEVPNSKRMMVTGWCPEDVDDVFVAPCHGVPWKCMVLGGKLHLVNFQRSADVFLGVPFNIASYSLLLLMIAQVTGLVPGECVCYLADTHLYLNQLDAAREQIKRDPLTLPRVRLNSAVSSIDGFAWSDVELIDYKAHPSIYVEPAV